VNPLQTIHPLRLGLIFLLIFVLVSLLLWVGQVMVLFLLASLFAYVLAPLVRRMSHWQIGRFHLGRGTSILILYAVFLLVLGLSGRLMGPALGKEFNHLLKDMPSLLVSLEKNYLVPLDNTLQDWLKPFAPEEPESPAPPLKAPMDGQAQTEQTVDTVTPPPSPWSPLLENYTFQIRPQGEGWVASPQRRKAGTSAEKPEKDPSVSPLQRLKGALGTNMIQWADMARRQVASVASIVFNTFMVMMIAAFILVNPKRINLFIQNLLPAAYHNDYWNWLKGMDEGLSGVVRGQIIIALLNGALTGVGLFLLSIPFAFTLSIIATLCSVIPVFGVLISSIPIVVLALTHSLSSALLMIGWILGIHFLEGNFFNPKIMGDTAKIHPALIVLALLVGEHAGGMVGALLAVPVYSILQSTFFFFLQSAEKLEHSGT